MRILLSELFLIEAPSPGFAPPWDIEGAKYPIVDVACTRHVDVTMLGFGAMVHLMHDGRADQDIEQPAIANGNMRMVQ